MVQVELRAMHANANDNGMADERPLVRVPVGRPEQAYAHQGNLILPLRFARLMPGWQPADGGSREAVAAAPASPTSPMSPTSPTLARRTAATWRPPSARSWRLGARRAPASR